MTTGIRFVNTIPAWDVKVGDKINVNPERSHFVLITAIDFNYPGGQHMGQGEDATVRLDVGWGCSYHAPTDLVEIERIDTLDGLLERILG